MKHDIRTTPWLAIALIIGVTACQGRNRQTMVVERQDANGEQPAAAQQPPSGNSQVVDPNADNGVELPGSDPLETAKKNKTGQVTVNGWNGEQDESADGNAWSVVAGSVSADVTVAPAATGTTTTVPSGTANSSAVTYDGKVSQVLAACTRCHGANGPNAPIMDTYDTAKANINRIIARSQPGGGMPPNSSVVASELQALQAWQAGGLLKAAASGDTGAATVPAAGNGLVLEITDQRYGNYLNQAPIQGRVGQTLKIVNKRTQGGFIIHTDGAPFDHGDVGNPIPPGGSQDYILQSPYGGDSGVYEHTDGSVNTDRLIKLQVTQ